jgi:hypothetical protein
MKEEQQLKRYYAGVDWADKDHRVYVGDENATKIVEMKVQETVQGLAEFGRWLDERRAEGTELWAAIEKPHGRIVDFLLDHRKPVLSKSKAAQRTVFSWSIRPEACMSIIIQCKLAQDFSSGIV